MKTTFLTRNFMLNKLCSVIFLIKMHNSEYDNNENVKNLRRLRNFNPNLAPEGVNLGGPNSYQSISLLHLTKLGVLSLDTKNFHP